MQSSEIKTYLNNYVNQELDQWDFSGVIRIIKNGKIFWETHRGYANLSFGIKNTMSTRFTAASVTKQFTAFAIMLLADRNLLSLDSPANLYLPQDMQILPEVTVHHLLSHTAGLYNYYNFTDDFYIGADRLPYDKKTFFRDWIGGKPMESPGKEFVYNNSNYTLLAWIIESISGESYEEFLYKNIFVPLDMYDTEFDDGMKILTNRAENYMHDYGKLVHVPYVNSLFHIGAGALVTNCEDLGKWYECLKQKKLLSAKTYDRFFRENLCHYCYGLERHTQNGVVKYAHGGDFNGVTNFVQYFFDDDICIFILSNSESVNQYRLGNAIADILYGKEVLHPAKPAEYPVLEEDLQQFTGTYLPGKIHIEVKNGKLYLVRVNHNIHIELYCIAPNTFLRRLEESSSPHRLLTEGAETPAVWGFPRVSKEFV